MMEERLSEYLDELASKDGLPGGGSAAGIVGAMSASLAQMVTEIQSGKKKYQDKQSEFEQFLKQANSLRDQFEALVPKDSKAFEPVSEAYSLPKTTEKEKEERQSAIHEALKGAARPPLEMMKRTIQVIDLFQDLVGLNIKGSIVNDIAVGVLFARTTLEASYLNVRVNADLLKDQQLKKSLEERSQQLLDEGIIKAERLYEASRYYLANKEWPPAIEIKENEE